MKLKMIENKMVQPSLSKYLNPSYFIPYFMPFPTTGHLMKMSTSMKDAIFDQSCGRVQQADCMMGLIKKVTWQ